MDTFLSTLKKVDLACQKHDLQYTIIGGVAVMYYESARVTQDIDLVVLAELGRFEKIFKAFSESGFVPIMPEPMRFFEQHFVCPMRDWQNQMKVDIVAAVSNFELQSIQRSHKVQIKDASIHIASIEDIILYKCFARRPKDILDAQGLLSKFGSILNKKYLQSTAKAFEAAERPDILEFINNFI
jgi:predicted nucleotidyltransferase